MGAAHETSRCEWGIADEYGFVRRVPATGMSIVARLIRRFEGSGSGVTLEWIMPLSAVPTVGTRLDLRGLGVAEPLEVIGVTIRPEPVSPRFLAPQVALLLAFEPLDAAVPARENGWRDVQPP